VGGDKVPLGSFLTAEAAARAYDGYAANTPGRALNFTAGYECGSARASRQCAVLTTRTGAHAHSLPQQRNDNDDDEPEQASDWSDAEGDDGDVVTSTERTVRDTARRKGPTAAVSRGSKADCAQYFGVSFDEGNASNPFQARTRYKSKRLSICDCPTAEAAARAYDALARMIPGRALNFPTTIPAAASSSRQRGQASAGPAKIDILAAIAAVRQAQPQLPPKGAVEYFGVSIDRTSACKPYVAKIRSDGKAQEPRPLPNSRGCSTRV
jgi:hypothetical protein